MRSGGVVLCNPFGYEAMCLHRCYRVLAERIAKAGIPALRFDYHGTGDSAGSDRDPDRVNAWLGSISMAIDELKRRAEIEEVSLFGVRLGATLAALAGIDRQDLAALVLWSPYLTGRAFVREMRMMQIAGAEQAFSCPEERGSSPEVVQKDAGSAATMRRGHAPSLGDATTVMSSDEEAIGYLLSASTVEHLSSIDLRAREIPSARRVLLLGRDDVPEDDRYARHLDAAGLAVTDMRRVGGYAAMMQDAYLSKVPNQAFDRIIDWIGGIHANVLPPKLEDDRATVLDLSHEGPYLLADSIDESTRGRAREEALMFGPTGQLLGILCEPAKRNEGPTNEAVIFLNIGSNHRVGSNRMYVKMARTFAARGLTSLRFDVSGIGDSTGAGAPGFENRLYAEEAVFDVQAAMDELRALRDIQSFFLVGLCSGAYLAFQTTHLDSRVAGQVLINSQTFRWKEGDTLDVSLRRNYRSTRFYVTEMWKPHVWARLLRGEVNAKGIAHTLATRGVERAKRGVRESIARVRDGRLENDHVAAQFEEILKRGTQTLLVFAESDGGIDQMESHLGPGAKKLQRFSNFRLEVVQGTDHTFTPMWSQTWLEKLVVDAVERWRPR